MRIPIGSLVITSFCADNCMHQRFKWDLMRDDKIYEFVSVNIGKDITNSEDIDNESKNVELNKSYLIQDHNKLVGYIYLAGIPNCVDIVELRYAVHPEYRHLNFMGYSDINRKGYGQQILEECGSYLFSFDNINAIDLHIRKDNEISIKCAKKAKYKYIGDNDDEYYYIYRKSRF